MAEENEIKTENNTELKINNSFNNLKKIQTLLKKESALKNLYSNTFKNIQDDINKLCREIFQEKLKVINVTKKGESPNIIFNHELVENNKEYMKELFLYVPKLLIYLWENPSLMAKLLINTNESDIKLYLAPLICDNFYENILSPNYIEDKLILIIYILLEIEINNLKNINDTKNFLNKTPCAFLLNQLISKKDIKEFFRIILKDNIENFETSSGDNKIFLNSSNIEKSIIEKQKSLKRKMSTKKNEKEVEHEKEDKKQIEEEKNHELFFMKYLIDLSFENLKEKKSELINLDKELLEQFIKYQLKEKKGDINIFSNKGFFQTMNTNSCNADEILKEYETNFLKLVNFINSIFDTIIENLDLLPFSIKCISKIICSLLEKKFPNINEIEKFSYISKFFINNLLVPILNNPAQGSLINDYIISNNTKYNINLAINIIEKFSSFIMYDLKNEILFSPFNLFFLENIHKLIKINEALINTKIHPFIKKILEGKISKNIKYDFFEENPNEVVLNRSMFLSMNHVKVIIKGIIPFLQDEDNFLQKIVFKILDNKENMQYMIELSDKNEKIVKKTVKNEKGKGKIKIEEQNIKYFLINDIIFNNNYKNLSNNKDNNTYFKLEETNTLKDKTENIIKAKNLISTSLRNYKILDETNFGIGKIGATFDILKKLKHFMKSTNYVVDEGIPSEWYIELLLDNLKKLPEEYKLNDYEKLYNELEIDIKKEIEFHDFELLSLIVSKMRFAERRKNFYNSEKDILKDINLNNNVNNIIENDEINIKFYFKYNKEKKKLNIYKEDLSERQLEFLNSFVFQDDKDVKTCKTIKSFTNLFPDLNKYANDELDNKSVFTIQKELNVPKELNSFFNSIRSHLINVKKIKDEKELNMIYNKLDDYVWSKIYNKLYPPNPDIMDHSLLQKFNIYTWIEPFHLIKDNYNYNFELILPKIINYFDHINTEKSPRKKIINMNSIFEAINTLLEFNQKKVNIGVDNQMPLLNYIFIKAKPKNIFTNCEFIELYIGDKIRKKEGNYLIQLKSIRDFTLNLTHNKLFNISFEEFNKNCQISLENNTEK